MEQASEEDVQIERSIKIIIKSIRNIIVKEETAISFIVIHNDVVLGESTFLIIEPGYNEPPETYNVNFTVELPFIINNYDSINLLVSTPVLIKVIGDTQIQHSIRSNIESKKNPATATQKQIESNVIGFCNLDLMPLLLGEKIFTEKLLVQTAYLSFDGNAISWQNLPKLTVTMIYEDEIFSPDTVINFLSITIESIYNIPEFFAKDMEYKAGTILYINKKTKDIIFEDGKWTKYCDVERNKRWHSLSKLQSRAKLSKWQISEDISNIRNSINTKFSLKDNKWQNETRIEWNYMNRSLMYDAQIEAMKKHINKYRYWPFQFMIPEIVKKDKKLKEEIKYQLYQCYLDLSELLFPGNKSTRVMGQLCTYNELEMFENVGLKKKIFDIEFWDKIIFDTKELEKNKTIQPILFQVREAFSNMLFSEIGTPVFVIIEVELYYPFVLCTLETDFSHVMDEMMKPKISKSLHIYTGDVAEDQYITCIQKLMEILTESYRDFREEKKRLKTSQKSDSNNLEKEDKEFCFVPEEDELTCFTQYLHKTGTYMNIYSTLKLNVITLLDQTFRIKMHTLHNVDSQNFIASIYTYLVEQMHVAINKIIESRLIDDDSSKIEMSETLCLYAVEAYELGYIDNAKRYYQTAIEIDKNNTNVWTKYAIFLLQINDVERAKECCREAILLNRRDRIALLMYGLILVGLQNFKEAEIFLKIVTEFYPRFVEGWFILHLFYILIDYYPGTDITLRLAEKCIREEYRETEFLNNESMIIWSTFHCPLDSTCMITFILLMKLHFSDLACIALAEEIYRTGESVHALYYLAVKHYCTRRYHTAIIYLKEAESIYGLDYSISSLLGHCYFQKNNFVNAIYYYQFANASFNRPKDIHFVQMRLGMLYENAGNYQESLKAFLSACNVSPTSESWLGVGVAFYELQQFTEAEAALLEANYIDNHNASVWKYLCFINMSLQRSDEFAQCYKQMIEDNATFTLEKRSLKQDKELLKLVML